MSAATDAALDLARDTHTHEGAIHPMLDRRLFGVRELTPRRFGWTVLFVALFTLWSAVPNIVATDGLRPSAATLAKYLPEFSAGYTLWMVPAMIVVSIADNLPLEGVRRTLALASDSAATNSGTWPGSPEQPSPCTRAARSLAAVERPH